MSLRGDALSPTLAPHASAGEQPPVKQENLISEYLPLNWEVASSGRTPSSQRHILLIGESNG